MLQPVYFGQLPKGVVSAWNRHKQIEAVQGKPVLTSGPDTDSIVFYPEATTQRLKRTVNGLLEYNRAANAELARIRDVSRQRRKGDLGPSETPYQLLAMQHSFESTLNQIRESAWQHIIAFQTAENAEYLLQALQQVREPIDCKIAKSLLEIRTLPPDE